MTPFSLVEEAWNYPLAYCSFLPDPKESDPKNVVRYALSRIAADIYRASSPRATDSANTGLEAWVRHFDQPQGLKLEVIAGATPPSPRSREAALASMFAAELKLLAKFSDIVCQDIEAHIVPAVLAMQKEEAAIASQDERMQRQQNAAMVLGVLSSAAALGGQVSAISSGRLTQAQQFQALNLQNTLQTIQIASSLQSEMDRLSERGAASSQALAARVGPITVEIGGETHTFLTRSLPDLRAKMLAKYQARFAK